VSNDPVSEFRLGLYGKLMKCQCTFRCLLIDKLSERSLFCQHCMLEFPLSFGSYLGDFKNNLIKAWQQKIYSQLGLNPHSRVARPGLIQSVKSSVEMQSSNHFFMRGQISSDFDIWGVEPCHIVERTLRSKMAEILRRVEKLICLPQKCRNWHFSETYFTFSSS